MECRYKEDVVALLHLVLILALQLPVCLIDEHQDPRPPFKGQHVFRCLLTSGLHGVVQDKKFLPMVFHGVLAEVPDQKGYVRGLAVVVLGRQGNGVLALIGEEHLQASAVCLSDGVAEDRYVWPYVNSTVMGTLSVLVAAMVVKGDPVLWLQR